MQAVASANGVSAVAGNSLASGSFPPMGNNQASTQLSLFPLLRLCLCKLCCSVRSISV